MLRPSFFAIALLLLASGLVSQCTDGCLRCNKIDENSSICEICDYTGFYVPFGIGLCLKIEIENCEVPTVDRSAAKCLRCIKGHIFDSTTNKCKPIAKEILNCERYDSLAACQQCAAGFYLLNAVCTTVPTENVIASCMNYNADATACNSCVSGFFLNAKTKLCEAVTKVDNCLVYTQNQCLGCSSGYIKNENYKMSLSFDKSFMAEIVQAEVEDKASNLFLANAAINNCQKTTVLNCVSFETFNKCTACSVGYFLVEGGTSCVLLPQEPIKNCLIYSNATTCLTCVNGAYKDGVLCKAATPVTNCRTYSQASDVCSECEYGFYYSTTQCLPRSVTQVSNQCKTFNPVADECAMCNPNFVLNTTKTGCLATIPSCLTDAVSGSDVVSCTTCLNGYGLDGAGLCQVQSVENCMTHTTNGVTCSECNNGFYIAQADMMCLVNTIENCGVKSKLVNECITCNTHFFLDTGNNNVCTLQNVKDCKVFTDNTNTCTECLTGFFIDGVQCTKYSLTNCTTPSTTANLCDTCADKYYKDDNAVGGCALQNRAFCKTYTDNLNLCTDCPNDYWLDISTPADAFCVKKNKPFCQTHVTGIVNENCLTCNVGYYEDSGNCILQAVQNCTTHTPNMNSCDLCKNLFYITGATCSAIAETADCYKSNGTTDACTICKPGFKYDGTALCTPKTNTNNQDDVCVGNTATTDDGVCTECPADHTRFKVTNFGVSSSATYFNIGGVTLTVANCLKFSDGTDTCEMCKLGFGSSSTTALCDTPFNPATDKCKQKKTAGIGELLSTTTNCEVCHDDYFSSTGTCTIRTPLSSNCESGHTDTAADSCSVCLKDTVFGSTADFNMCIKTQTGVTYGTNCLTSDIDNIGNCLSCATADTDLTTCTTTMPTNGGVFNMIDVNIAMVPIVAAAADETTSCLTFYGMDSLNKVTCMKCDTDKIRKIVSYNSALQINGKSFVADQKLGLTETATSNIPILPFSSIPSTRGGCVAWSTMATKIYQNTDGVPLVEAPDPNPTAPAATAFTFVNSDKFENMVEIDGYAAVVSCVKTHYPSAYLTGVYNPSDVDANVVSGSSPLLLTVGGCTPYDGTQKVQQKYHGLGYKSESVIPLPAIIHFDSCVQSSDLFFFVGEILVDEAIFGGSGFHSIYPKDASAGTGNALCVPKLDDTGVAHTVVANCQVHLHDADVLATIMGGAITFKCLACEPGYKATINTANKFEVTACTLIDNCDLTNDSSNTWMNMCQTCKPGYSWDMAADGFRVNLDSCTENNVSNCAVIKTTTTDDCMICENGYDIDSSSSNLTCSKMSINNCTSFNFHGISHFKTGAPTDNADLWKKLVDLNAFLHWFTFGITKQYKSGCGVCSSGFQLAAASSATNKFCTGSSTLATTIADCEYYGIDNTIIMCKKCKAGKISQINTSPAADTCVAAITAEVNCLRRPTTGTAGENCTLCTGFRLPATGTCYAYTDCDVIDSVTPYKCLQCKPGFMPATNEYDCIPIAETDPCEVYKIGKICLKCKAAKSPVTIVSGGVGIRVNCVTKYTASASAFTTMFENNAYVIDIDASTDDTKFKTEDVYSATGTYNFHKFMASTVLPNISVCVASPMVSHCKVYNTSGFRTCTTCEDGYKLKTADFTCIDGHIDNCITYTGTGLDSDTCTKCDMEFYLESSTKCTKRNHTNCKTFTTGADTCETCHPDNWNPNFGAAGTCNEYTVEHCATFTNNLNTCATCVPNVRYLDGGECKLYTKQFCKDFSTSEDKCTACHPDRWLDSASTHECMEYTVSNCNAYNATTDVCDTCLSNYFKVGNNCLPPAAEFCETRNATLDQCDSCITGYWMNGTACEQNTALNCRTKMTNANTCNECLAGHYKDAADLSKCKPHTIDFCSTYTLTANTCEICAANYFKNGSSLCEINTSLNCSQKSVIADECVICDSDYYLLSGINKCSPVSNVTCVTITPNENKCATCVSTRYNDLTSGECKTLTIVENCMAYEVNLDKCMTCNTGFYKSADSLSCFPNPDGIIGCTSYSDLTTCSACRNTHYLSTNTCVELVADAKTNCAAYSGDGICSACDATFSLDNGECAANVASGCVTWADKDNCATCAANQILNSGACTTTAISGCAVTSGTVGAETCLMCETNMFLATNTCTTSGTVIPECILYSADGVCAKCSAGNVTSSDGSACAALSTATFGPHCAFASTNTPPSCVVCGGGFLMDATNQCSVACEASNCGICNPDDVSKCNLCKTGYHMTSEMVCAENDQRAASVQIVRVLTVVMALFLLTWK